MSQVHPLIPKFERALALTEAERVALIILPIRLETVKSDQAILREGSRPTRACFLTEGLACNSKIGPNGRRQILAFHIPGDTPDLTSLHLEVRDSDTWALTDCTLAFIDHSDVDELCDEQPRIARFLWRLTLVDTSVHREWTMNVGLREAIVRMAHLFCEIMTRMEFIDRAQGGQCAFPVTQEDLAEATGLSPVHVNRVLQDLRRQKLLSFAKGKLTIHDRAGLEELGDFRADYLHLMQAKAA